jgi:hypothetical protein
MTKTRAVAGVLLFGLPLLWGFAGCSRKPEDIATRQARTFQSASAETKALWETAVSATRSNDYFTTLVTLRKVRMQADLSAEQLAAVDETLRAVSEKMNTAANNGDAEAKRAIEELKKSRGR